MNYVKKLLLQKEVRKNLKDDSSDSKSKNQDTDANSNVIKNAGYLKSQQIKSGKTSDNIQEH